MIEKIKQRILHPDIEVFLVGLIIVLVGIMIVMYSMAE